MLISKESKIFIAGHNGMVGSAIKRSLIKKADEKSSAFLLIYLTIVYSPIAAATAADKRL